MAKPIKDTPILEGKDAELFNERIKQSGKMSLSKEKFEEMEKQFLIFSKILKDVIN